MGNITGKDTDSDDEDQVGASGSMHSNMLRQMKHNDVFKKYKTMEVLVGPVIFNFIGCRFGQLDRRLVPLHAKDLGYHIYYGIFSPE
jgi:hypothetical protein